jgi:iron complex transport system ATP-binding protein
VAARRGAQELAVTASLSAEALDFGYPGRIVGRNVSLTLASGELVALLGPNGVGKSTLFRTMLGLLAPRGGNVLLDGTRMSELPRAAVARRVAYVPQTHVGYFPFSALDVVVMGRTAHLSPFAGPSHRDRTLARESLERVGMARLAGDPYTRLSGGERQLVLIARALAQEAPLIVMDEPTASLDFGNQALVLREIAQLKANGAGILLATHDPDQALLLADRVALLHDGKIVADAKPADALTPASLRTLYGVDVEIREVGFADGSTRRLCIPT